jgi:hypothetical protein
MRLDIGWLAPNNRTSHANRHGYWNYRKETHFLYRSAASGFFIAHVRKTIVRKCRASEIACPLTRDEWQHAI